VLVRKFSGTRNIPIRKGFSKQPLTWKHNILWCIDSDRR